MFYTINIFIADLRFVLRKLNLCHVGKKNENDIKDLLSLLHAVAW